MRMQVLEIKVIFLVCHIQMCWKQEMVAAVWGQGKSHSGYFFFFSFFLLPSLKRRLNDMFEPTEMDGKLFYVTSSRSSSSGMVLCWKKAWKWVCTPLFHESITRGGASEYLLGLNASGSLSHKKPDVLVDAKTSGSSVKEDEAKVWYCTATHSCRCV